MEKTCSNCKHHRVEKQPNKPEYVCWCDFYREEYAPFDNETACDWWEEDA